MVAIGIQGETNMSMKADMLCNCDCMIVLYQRTEQTVCTMTTMWDVFYNWFLSSGNTRRRLRPCARVRSINLFGGMRMSGCRSTVDAEHNHGVIEVERICRHPQVLDIFELGWGVDWSSIS